MAQLATIYPAGRHLVYLPFVDVTLHLLHYLLALRDGHAIMLADPAQDARLHHEQCQRFGVSLRVLEDGAVAHLAMRLHFTQSWHAAADIGQYRLLQMGAIVANHILMPMPRPSPHIWR